MFAEGAQYRPEGSTSLCEACGVQPASVHVARLEDGRITTSDLCQSCAQTLGEEMGGNGLVFALPAAMGRFFGSMMGVEPQEPVEEDDGPDFMCGVCGTTTSDVHESGLLGCASCYDVFEGYVAVDAADEALEHLGKVPARNPQGATDRREVLRLRRMLLELVDSERYEEAAGVRDRLTELGEMPQG